MEQNICSIYTYNGILLSLFIHSFVDGHLGCFYILTVLSNAAMNIVVHVSFLTSVFIFYGYIPRSGVAGTYVSTIFSFFEKPPNCFSQWLYQFTFILALYEGFLFQVLANIYYLWVVFFFFFCILAAPHGMPDGSPTRD